MSVVTETAREMARGGRRVAIEAVGRTARSESESESESAEIMFIIMTMTDNNSNSINNNPDGTIIATYAVLQAVVVLVVMDLAMRGMEGGGAVVEMKGKTEVEIGEPNRLPIGEMCMSGGVMRG